MSRGEPEALKHALHLLARLMRGEVLSATDRSSAYPYNEAAGRRHLRALEAAIPYVKSIPGKPTRWRFEWPTEQASRPATVWSLAAARVLLAPFHESTLGDELDRLFERERQRLEGAPPAGDLSRMFVMTARAGASPELDPGALDSLVSAMFSGFEVRATYVHFGGEEDDVTLQPLSIVQADEGTYCHAVCMDSVLDEHVGTRRNYNLRRFRPGVRVTRRPYVYPLLQDYDPKVTFRHSFGEFLPAKPDAEPSAVRLGFAPTWARFLRTHRVHVTQSEPSERADGWVEVELVVHVTYDLVRWVRGIGKEVQVLAPDSLARWVASGEGASFASQK